MILTCIVVDDEPLAVELMESYVRKTPFLDLRGSFHSASAVFEAVEKEPVNLLLCDIQMPGLSGMDLARMLPASTRVILTTAFSTYAVEGFRVNAVDYLLKPISYPDFLAAARRALDWFEMSAGVPDVRSDVSSIYVKSGYRIVRIAIDDILYIEGLKDYIKIYLRDSDAPVLSLMSMKALEEELPADRFVRVHKSFIVQPARMSYVERGRIVFGKTHIPVSDTYRQAFLDFLSRYSLYHG